jgi:prepilin-type N-terminal cleavage/methylation domain-containing protein
VIENRWKQLRKLTRNNQKGFTLIELLVVVSIIGILAAVVTMSMVGVTKLAQGRASDAERATVQSAIDTMANEQLASAGSVCTDGANATGTNDMSSWPAGQMGANEKPPTGHPIALYPRYLRQQNTHGTYRCNGDGVVTQTGYTP